MITRTTRHRLQFVWFTCVTVLAVTGCAASSADDSATRDERSDTVASATVDANTVPTPVETIPTRELTPDPVLDSGPAVLESIAQAEEEAQSWPTAPPPETLPSGFNDFAGSSERACVNVELGLARDGAWRSGEFLAGNFDRYLEERPNDPDYSKLWWKPLHNTPEYLSDVTVRAVRLEGPGEAVQMEVFEFDQVASPAPPPDVTPTPLPEGGHPDSFFPSLTELPTLGTWMLVATMGPDWGCFILEL